MERRDGGGVGEGSSDTFTAGGEEAGEHRGRSAGGRGSGAREGGDVWGKGVLGGGDVDDRGRRSGTRGEDVWFGRTKSESCARRQYPIKRTAVGVVLSIQGMVIFKKIGHLAPQSAGDSDCPNVKNLLLPK